MKPQSPNPAESRKSNKLVSIGVCGGWTTRDNLHRYRASIHAHEQRRAAGVKPRAPETR